MLFRVFILFRVFAKCSYRHGTWLIAAGITKNYEGMKNGNGTEAKNDGT